MRVSVLAAKYIYAQVIDIGIASKNFTKSHCDTMQGVAVHPLTRQKIFRVEIFFLWPKNFFCVNMRTAPNGAFTW